MATGEDFKHRVLVFDETQKQTYANAVCEGVKMVGGIAMPFDDPKFALEEFDGAVKALVTTMAPASTDRIENVPKDPSALITRARELSVPVGLVTMQSMARSLMAPGGSDAIFDSYPGRTDLLPGQIARWLVKLSVRHFPPDEEVEERTPRPKIEITAAEAAGAMLGGDARMNLGLFIAGWDPEEKGDFTAAQLTNKVGDASPTAIAKNLQVFWRWGLLEREKGPSPKTVTYRRTDSPLWRIYRAAGLAIDELNAQTDKPK